MHKYFVDSDVLRANIPRHGIGRPSRHGAVNVHMKAIVMTLFADFTTAIVNVLMRVVNTQKSMITTRSVLTLRLTLALGKDITVPNSVSERQLRLSGFSSISDLFYFNLQSPYGSKIKEMVLSVFSCATIDIGEELLTGVQERYDVLEKNMGLWMNKTDLSPLRMLIRLRGDIAHGRHDDYVSQVSLLELQNKLTTILDDLNWYIMVALPRVLRYDKNKVKLTFNEY